MGAVRLRYVIEGRYRLMSFEVLYQRLGHCYGIHPYIFGTMRLPCRIVNVSYTQARLNISFSLLL
jgi:hypothetical protein